MHTSHTPTCKKIPTANSQHNMWLATELSCVSDADSKLDITMGYEAIS